MNFFSPISMQGGYIVRIVSETQESGIDRIIIDVNEYFIIIDPKDINAQSAIKNWHINDYGSEISMKAKLEKLQSLISNEEQFSVISNQREAYLEFLRVRDKNWRSVFKNIPPSKYPVRPEKSFELMKDWYYEVLSIDKSDFLKRSMDSSPEVLNTFEIDFINSLLVGMKETMADAKAIIKKTELEKIAVQTFEKWLSERKAALEVEKAFTEGEDSPVADIENWTKKARTCFLLELGIDQLPVFKQAGQNEKYKIIANILNCSTRKAREYYNHSKETVTNDEKQSIIDFLNKIKKN